MSLTTFVSCAFRVLASVSKILYYLNGNEDLVSVSSCVFFLSSHSAKRGTWCYRAPAIAGLNCVGITVN